MTRLEIYKLPNLSKYLLKNDRILILGAGGWFGQTMLQMLDGGVQKMAIGSSKRDYCEIWDLELIENFKPTIVLNFAFITRNRLKNYNRSEYISINLELIERMRIVGQMNSVRLLLTVSSGAALDPQAQQGLESEEIYGALKKYEECAALSCQALNRSVVVLRAYSLSGPFVRDASQYAFSSFIQQAIFQKEIHISATNQVYRRYCSVGDLLAVGIGRAMQGWSGVIESGGHLLELGELADLVGRLLHLNLRSRPMFTSLVVDRYYSDNESWQRSLEELQFKPLNIDEQIESTIEFIIRNPK